MAHYAPFLALVLSSFAHAVVVIGEPPGFLCLDCGKPDGFFSENYFRNVTCISDSQYIATGETKKLSQDFVKPEEYDEAHYDVRSFPNGTRNCYSLPVDKGKKYLVRAFFVYGNYDGKNYFPNFDLYIGINFWWPIRIVNNKSWQAYEIFIVAPSKILSVCLVDTGAGTPFISGLELRPLPDTLYKEVTDSQSLVYFDRIDAGGNGPNGLRYPTDAYDRIWGYSPSQNKILNTTFTVTTTGGYEPPLAVMQTANTTNETSLQFSWADTKILGTKHPLYNSLRIIMHFSELEVIKANESRKFDISLNGEAWNESVSPTYLKTTTVTSATPKEYDKLDFTISMTSDSTLPPIVNAVEIYRVINITELETNIRDVDAIRDIKEKYKVQRNWMGDPCAPRKFTWDGLECSYSDSKNPIIISLNLASAGIIGDISASLSNLTELQQLDLSGNELEGNIPEFFTSLSNLRYLNLSGNKLSGLVPKGILDRSTMGTLIFSASDNPDLCIDYNACAKSESKSKVMIVITASVCSATIILLIILLALWRSKGRKHQRMQNKSRNGGNGDPTNAHSNSFRSSSFHRESRQFTNDELVMVTDNFKTSIGKGGFGTVYYGVLENGVPVAVKMLSESSSQGTKEFKTEARLLTRIHHRNLVPLVGYCTDVNHLALVYEYMAGGSLANHILGNASDKNMFIWRDRLRVATESAQGLEYLHKGCKPAIIHRDVKPSNILLNEKLEARIADFGLSKSFQNDIHSHVYTTVMGTPGYLDPEYYHTNMLNEKSDVYSFGVILLELVTGQPATIRQGKNNVHIVKWVQQKLERGDINAIIDTRLADGYDINSVWKVIEIALSCTSQVSTHRPTMTQVLMLLKDGFDQETMYEYEQNNNSSNANNDETIKMIPEYTNAILNPSVR